MADDTNAAQQVAFKVTNVSTGEAHVVVTDRNGDFSSASGWNRHSSNTNGNDHLLEAGYITADMMDPKAGVWFSLGEDGTQAEVDDDLAAFPVRRVHLGGAAKRRQRGLPAHRAHLLGGARLVRGQGCLDEPGRSARSRHRHHGDRQVRRRQVRLGARGRHRRRGLLRRINPLARPIRSRQR